MATTPAHNFSQMHATSDGVDGGALSRSKAHIRPYLSKVSALERLLDGFYIYAILWCLVEALGTGWRDSFSLLAVVALLFYNFFAEIFEVYYDWRGSPMYREAGRIAAAWLCAAATLLLIGSIAAGLQDFAGIVVAAWMLAVAPALLLSHTLFRAAAGYLRRRGKNTRNVAIVGCNDLGLRLLACFESMPWLGYRATGFYDDRSEHGGRRPRGDKVKVVGGFDALYQDARDGKVDILYITLPLRSEKRVEKLLDRLADTTVSAYFVPDFFVFNLMHSRWTTMQGIPALSVYETPFAQLEGFSKRLEDVVLASLMLVVLAIPMLLIALGIRVTSKGPVIFRQRRYGMRGQTIEVWKFRTMTVCEDGEHVPQATRNDPRVTRFGRFLRSNSLDELPQLFNVLRGSMSLVGPRPHAVAHNEQYRKYVPGYMLRHKVKPGITGLAQVSGCRGEIRNEEMLKRRIHYDLEYIRNWSLILDISILVRTAFKGLFGEQAY